MKTERNRKEQWLLAAFAAPAAHFAGCGWLSAALMAAALLPLRLLPKKWEGMPKSLVLAQFLWLGIVAGCLLPASAVCWPSDNRLAVPLTILALAVWTGSAAAPRIGTVVAFCMILLAIPLGISGVANLRGEWLRPSLAPWSAGLGVTLLLPNLMPGEKGTGKPAGPGILTVLLSILVQGVISLPVSADMEDAFYQTARTLGYLEPIAAVAVTLGWYALASLLLERGRETAKSSGMGHGMATVLVSGTAALCILWGVQLDGPVLTVLSAFLWVLIPFLTKINFFEKR